MALLNPPDILPEAMRFLLRTLLASPERQCEQDTLLALVAPEGLAEVMRQLGTDAPPENDGEPRGGGRHIAECSLAALRQLGLVDQDKQTVRASALALSYWTTTAQVTAKSFAYVLRARVWTCALSTSDAKSHGSTDLVRGLAVLAVAPQPLVPFESFDTAGRRFDQHLEMLCGDKQDWPFPNATQWQSFRRFGSYLGLAQPVTTKGLIADGSRALREDLNKLAPGSYNIDEFVAACAEAVPIFDGGIFHHHDGREDRELSTGLSLSLRQMEADGTLQISQPKGDSASRDIVLGPERALRRPVTHVVWSPSATRQKGPVQ